MAIHQRIKDGNFDVLDINLPHNSKGHMEGLISGGTTVKFHKPRGSKLSMLINGKQRVNL